MVECLTLFEKLEYEESQKQDGLSVVIVPPLKSANADTDENSNLSDVESVENVNHLPQ